jgi:hypothetical protein
LNESLDATSLHVGHHLTNGERRWRILAVDEREPKRNHGYDQHNPYKTAT